ncbi:MAG: hypothetical protein ACP5MX_03885, partial [Candidatus Micrarchaeia archaeon]
FITLTGLLSSSSTCSLFPLCNNFIVTTAVYCFDHKEDAHPFGAHLRFGVCKKTSLNLGVGKEKRKTDLPLANMHNAKMLYGQFLEPLPTHPLNKIYYEEAFI